MTRARSFSIPGEFVSRAVEHLARTSNPFLPGRRRKHQHVLLAEPMNQGGDWGLWLAPWEVGSGPLNMLALLDKTGDPLGRVKNVLAEVLSGTFPDLPWQFHCEGLPDIDLGLITWQDGPARKSVCATSALALSCLQYVASRDRTLGFCIRLTEDFSEEAIDAEMRSGTLSNDELDEMRRAVDAAGAPSLRAGAIRGEWLVFALEIGPAAYVLAAPQKGTEWADRDIRKQLRYGCGGTAATRRASRLIDRGLDGVVVPPGLFDDFSFEQPFPGADPVYINVFSDFALTVLQRLLDMAGGRVRLAVRRPCESAPGPSARVQVAPGTEQLDLFDSEDPAT